MDIKINKLEYSFQDNYVLKDINAEFEQGKLYGIVGPNGSGKTTLIKLLSRLLKSKKDSLFIYGKELNEYKDKEIARKTSLVPQMFHISHGFSVEEVVAMGRYPHLKDFAEMSVEDWRLVKDALELTSLTELKYRQVNELSVGELQRVILARAIAQDTPIMLLDEPLSHLDIHHQLEILHLLKDLCDKKKKTILCVMHDLNLTMKFADQVLLINEGRIFKHGQVKDVLTQENIYQVYKIKVNIENIDNQSIIIF